MISPLKAHNRELISLGRKWFPLLEPVSDGRVECGDVCSVVAPVTATPWTVKGAHENAPSLYYRQYLQCLICCPLTGKHACGGFRSYFLQLVICTWWTSAVQPKRACMAPSIYLSVPICPFLLLISFLSISKEIISSCRYVGVCVCVCFCACVWHREREGDLMCECGGCNHLVLTCVLSDLSTPDQWSGPVLTTLSCMGGCEWPKTLILHGCAITPPLSLPNKGLLLATASSSIGLTIN